MEYINNYIATLTADQFIVGFLAFEIGAILLINAIVYGISYLKNGKHIL